jgi:hypothetical protein
VRNAGRLKLGYFPLPIEEARNIRRLLVAETAFFAIDPCAGEGIALLETLHGLPASPAAVELDADRAAACIAHGIPTVHGSVFDAHAPAESCSLLYLNPPYDVEIGRFNNQRMELHFLDHVHGWLKTGGVLIFVIPDNALAPCAKCLAGQFDRIAVYRLGHPESIRFRQLVVLATRKKEHQRGDTRNADSLIRASYSISRLPVLNRGVTEQYAIPPSEARPLTYKGLDLDQLEDALQRSTAMQNAMAVLVRQQERITGRPVTPLHGGHVGLLTTAGMLNGIFGEGELRHIAHWRSVKHTDVLHEEEEDGTQVVRKRERFSHELTLAFADGRIQELKEGPAAAKAQAG